MQKARSLFSYVARTILILASLLPAFAADPDPANDRMTKMDLVRLLNTQQFDQLNGFTAKGASTKPSLTKGYSLHNLIKLLESPTSSKSGGESWEDHIRHLEAWISHSPKSVYPRIILGGAYIEWAWNARGGEFADKVSNEGWELFAQRLRKADAILKEAEKIASDRSELYSKWLTVAYALQQPDKTVDRIFEKGRAADRDDLRLYYVMANFLLPRWKGVPGEWEKFATTVADERGGSEGDFLYTQIARKQAWSEGDAFFKNTKISYERMKKGFAVALRDSDDSAGDLNAFCYFACIAGDKTTARSLFPKIGTHWRKASWKNEGNYQKWKNWAESGAK